MGKALPALIVLGGSAGLTYYAYTQGYLNSILIKMGMEKYITCPKGTVWSIEEGECVKEEVKPPAQPPTECSKITTEDACWIAQCQWCKTPTDTRAKCHSKIDYPYACIDCTPAICFETSGKLTEHNEIYHPKRPMQTVVGKLRSYWACNLTKNYNILFDLGRKRYIQNISGTINTGGNRTVHSYPFGLPTDCKNRVKFRLDGKIEGESSEFRPGDIVSFALAVGKVGRLFEIYISSWLEACCTGRYTMPYWAPGYIKGGSATFAVGYI